jgi:hypothetical protein
VIERILLRRSTARPATVATRQRPFAERSRLRAAASTDTRRYRKGQLNLFRAIVKYSKRLPRWARA